MAFLATNFLYFLAAAFVFTVLFIVLSYRRVNKFHKQSKAFRQGGERPNPFAGMMPIALCAAVVGFCLLLAVIGAIAYFLPG